MLSRYILDFTHTIKKPWNWTAGVRTLLQLRTLCSNTSPRRHNPVDIHMLSRALRDQIFQSASEPQFDEAAVNKSKEHLEKHGLWGKRGTVLPDISFQLPPLYGSNIDEHFCEIAKEQSKFYFEKAQMLSKCTLPEMPARWNFKQGGQIITEYLPPVRPVLGILDYIYKKMGWTKYERREQSIMESTVDYPEDDGLVLDVEVCLTAGPFPTIAVAASPRAWYSWVSPRLIEERTYQWLAKPTPDLFVPLESRNTEDINDIEWNKRLVIGHNVGYDRSCLKEQYYIKGSKTHFLDTLSLHMCVSGLSRSQRGLWESTIKKQKEKVPWMLVGSGNKLQDVHQLYIGGEELDKSQVKVFLEGSMEDVREQFQELMTYCAKDVAATHEVFCEVWPKFLERFPHPVTFAGMLEMGTAYLPVDQSWDSYLRDADNAFDDLENEVKKTLMKLANDCCRYLHNKRYTEDPWLWSLDWSVQDLRVKKLKPSKKRKKGTADIDEKAAVSTNPIECDEEDPLEPEGAEYKRRNSLSLIPRAEDIIHKRRQHMPGYPKWYRNLCMKVNSVGYHPGPVLVTPGCQIAPLLLRMTWDGFPLYYSQKHGWGYLVPGRRDNLTPYEQPEGTSEKHKIESDSADNPFPTKAFEELWRRYEKKRQFDETLGTLDEEDIDWIRSITKEESWLDAEFDENKKLKKSIAQLLKQETVSLMDENSDEHSSNTIATTGPPAVKRRSSRPDFYHGVGPYNDVDLPGVWFFRIPHKNGESSRCGNPLAQDYLSKIQDGTLVSLGDKNAHQTLVQSRMTGNWKSIKSRVKQQLVVWLDDDLPKEMRSSKINKEVKRGAIIPRVIAAGTVTRRAVETTWLVATNPRENLVGSELKAMVRAPPGYYFIGADVDSQELWIAAILGDAQYTGIHGSTALGWMTLQGKKSEGTDLHSKTAQTVGISRDHAKVFNYGRIYGAGQRFAEKLLQQFNHRLTEREAREKAELLYASTKGKIRYKLTKNGVELAEKCGYLDKVDENKFVNTRTYYELLRRSKRRRKGEDNISEGKRWVGGSESEMFNKLEQIAQSDEPRTPVLGCRISKALEPRVVGNEFLMSRVNWVVQSSAVDYLHLMLVCMRWLFTKYNIEGRFCISIHDEVHISNFHEDGRDLGIKVRYLVSEKDKYRAALALQVTNLLTRAMFAYKLNMHDLPQSVAFFSAVDIDTVLRKEVHLDCKTPSNPMGLEKGHGIPPGEALDIYQILEKTNNGCLSPDNKMGFQESEFVSRQ